MNREPNKGGQWLADLMRSPVDSPERQQLRDAVPYSQKTLDRLTRKYLSLSPEFKPNPVSVDRRPLPTYEAWLRSAGLTPKEAKRQAAADSIIYSRSIE